MGAPLILFIGGRSGDFTLLSGTIGEDSGSGAFDSAYSDCAVWLSAAGLVKLPFTDASGTPVSVVAGQSIDVVGRIFESRFNQIIAGGVLTLYSAANQPWMRINSPSNSLIQLQYNSGTGAVPVWSNLGLSINCGLGGVMNVAVKIAANGTHTALFALGSSAVFSGTFTAPGLTDISYATILNTDPGGTMFLAEIMAARDMGLVGARVKTIKANGAGTYSQWTGAAANVNKISVNDATYDVTTTVGQNQSYNVTDIVVPPQYAIASVVYRLRLRNDGGVTAAQNIKPLLRSGGADYIGSDLPAITGAFVVSGVRYDVNPATGSAWNQTTVNAIELGYQSDT